jgi:glyoxylase-like metal-dependent hydrolase (beta-lactamase superfamily II)
MKTPSTVAVAIGFVLASAATSAQDLSSTEIKISHVAGSVYMLEGAGGNIGASVGDDGIVIVDDQYAPLAEKIKAALKNVADKPVRFVINTHYHDDHTNGNFAFNKDALIIAHDNLRKRLENREATPENAGKVTGATPEALPLITFDHDLTIHANGEEVRAMFIPNGHTDGDTVVYFSKSNVLAAGDEFVRYGFPYVDLAAGGTVNGMIAACENVIAQLPADVKIIPGHGQLSNLDDVRKFAAMLKDTRAAVERGVRKGKSLEQLKQEKVLEPWKEWASSFITADTFTEMLYRDVTGSKGGEQMKHN